MNDDNLNDTWCDILPRNLQQYKPDVKIEIPEIPEESPQKTATNKSKKAINLLKKYKKYIIIIVVIVFLIILIIVLFHARKPCKNAKTDDKNNNDEINIEEMKKLRDLRRQQKQNTSLFKTDKPVDSQTTNMVPSSNKVHTFEETIVIIEPIMRTSDFTNSNKIQVIEDEENTLKDTPKDTPKDLSKDLSKDLPKDLPIEQQIIEIQDNISEDKKDISNELDSLISKTS